MSRMTSRSVVVGRIAHAEICPCAQSVVLSLGGLSLRLERAAAEDVAMTLMQALAHLGSADRESQSAVGPADTAPGSAPPRSEESN